MKEEALKSCVEYHCCIKKTIEVNGHFNSFFFLSKRQLLITDSASALKIVLMFARKNIHIGPFSVLGFVLK